MLHKSKMLFIKGFLLLFPFVSLFAQLPVDGFYSKKNTLTIAPSYSYKSFGQFYRGSELADGNPAGLGDISSSIVSIFTSYAINDWLSSTVTLPYITVKSQDGVLDPVHQVDQVEGIQDLGLFAKARAFEKNLGNTSKISVGGVTGVTFPVGDYEGSGVLSLGNQATTVNGSALVNYVSPFKIFTELQFGYSYRTSNDFDIPNAMTYGVKLGYYNRFLYVHAQLQIQDSTSGYDIGTPEFASAGGASILPETEVDYTNLSFDFYVPFLNNTFGASAGYATTLTGRNFSKESALSIGLVYKSQ